MKKVLVTLAAALVLTGCATGYHSTNLTGGLTQTRLSERVYRVRFQGNGYTSQERTSVFLLRRCAELTLENGFRYFTLGAQGTGSMESGASGFIFSFPHGTATVKFLEKEADDPTPLDAVIVVKDTDDRAGGKISEKARWKLLELSGGPQPIPPGTKLSLSSGEPFGEVLGTELKHTFTDGHVAPATCVKLVRGGEAWVSLEQARSMAGAPAAGEAATEKE